MNENELRSNLIAILKADIGLEICLMKEHPKPGEVSWLEMYREDDGRYLVEETLYNTPDHPKESREFFANKPNTAVDEFLRLRQVHRIGKDLEETVNDGLIFMELHIPEKLEMDVGDLAHYNRKDPANFSCDINGFIVGILEKVVADPEKFGFKAIPVRPPLTDEQLARPRKNVITGEVRF
jgi:hypothetical protein